eukprot:2627163-Pleurochrysis_carterae.AAC.1
MHVNDFDDDYLPLANIDDDILLCLHTTAANASDVPPPPKNYKDINGRADKSGAQLAASRSSRAR